MIILIEDNGEQMVFDNVTSIVEKWKSSVLGGTRSVVIIFSGEQILAGGDDIDLMTNKLRILPNAERSAEND